jgi:hypothetical protein
MTAQTVPPPYDLRASLAYTFEQLIKILHSFKETGLNQVPETGGWSAAQVAEHLRKSYTSVERIGQAATICERLPDEKRDLLRMVFLDFTKRFEAAAAIQPSPGRYNKEELLQSLTLQTEQVQQLAGRPDLSFLCTELPVPFFGELTQYEWLCLYDFHTLRHIEQLKRIQSELFI